MIAHGLAALAVTIGYADYSPADLHVVAGETVTWSQESVRRHTVTARDGSFDSGTLVRGEHYRRTFATTGAHPYYCRLHAGITGSVTAYEVVLDQPPQAAAPGRAYPLTGRAAGGIEQVTVRGDDGTAVTAEVAQDGRFTAHVAPATTTTYRAADSPPVTLRVLDRTVIARVTGPGRVVAVVSPGAPGATVVLQLRLRERFGWWPVARRRLDEDGAVTLRTRVRRPVRARAVLTLRDGATPLAFSPVVRLAPPAPHGHGHTS